jgi:outer membrane protein assembly factor BamA
VLTVVCTSAYAQHVAVSSIEITGNKHTKDFVILRELLLQKDTVYAQDDEATFSKLLELSKNRISNLNLFNKVDFLLEPNQEKNDTVYYILKIAVLEKWYIWPIPFIEFSDRNVNVWGGFDFDPERTNYGIYAFNYNLFGRNHTLKTNLKTGYNKELGFEYRIPFISKTSNWGVIALAKYESQNEVWLKTTNDSLRFFKNGDKNLIQYTEARIEVSKRIKPLVKIFAGVSLQKGELASAVPDSGYFLNDNETQLTYGIDFKTEIDSRNNIYFPTTGFFCQPIISLQQWTNTSSKTNLKIQIKAQTFKQIAPKWYSALSGYLHHNTAQTIPYFSRKMFGYNEIIRGYESYVIDGSSGWKVNTAIRYHLLDKSDLKLNFIPGKSYKVLPINIYIEGYLDGGRVAYANPDQTNKLVNTLLYSCGLGVNTLVYNDRLLRLEYSINSLQEGGFFVHFKKAI